MSLLPGDVLKKAVKEALPRDGFGSA